MLHTYTTCYRADHGTDSINSLCLVQHSSRKTTCCEDGLLVYYMHFNAVLEKKEINSRNR